MSSTDILIEVTSNDLQITAEIQDKIDINIEVTKNQLQIIAELESKTTEINAEVLAAGPRGPIGPLGPIGPPGETYTHPATHPAEMITESEERVFLSNQEKTALLTFKESYVHDQLAAQSIWLVQHDLNKYPNITIIDSAGTVVIGEIEYVSKNILILRFSAEFSGKAYLS